MKRLKKCIILVSVLAIVVFTGCGSKGSSGSANMKLLMVVDHLEGDPFREMLIDAATNAAASEGVSMDIVDSRTIEEQVNNIKSAKSSGYDMIFCLPASADTAVELKADAGDLPLMFFNSAPDDKYLEKDTCMYVGCNEYTAGQYQAEYVLEKLSANSELNVALLKGPADHSGAYGRTKGVKKTLSASGKTIHYVFDDYANWSRDKAKEQFGLFLKTKQPVDCVLCNNDEMALGVIDACKEAGIDPSSILICGVDATAGGCEAIKDGDMAFTVFQPAIPQGEAIIALTKAILTSGKSDKVEGVTEDGKHVYVPFEKVDSKNVDQYS